MAWAPIIAVMSDYDILRHKYHFIYIKSHPSESRDEFLIRLALLNLGLVRILSPGRPQPPYPPTRVRLSWGLWNACPYPVFVWQYGQRRAPWHGVHAK